MVLSMARPWKHPKTGVYWFRKAVPADLRSIIGKREELRSLRTKDPAEARQRHAAIVAVVEKQWSALRKPSQPLTHKQIVALSGLVYRTMVKGHEDDPGSSSMWQGFIAFQSRVLNPDRVKDWLGPIVDAVLLREGIRTDEASRERLIEEVRKASNQAAEQLKRNAEGDYRPDPNAARFPDWTPPSPEAQSWQQSQRDYNNIAISELLAGWWREAKAVGRSVSTYQSYSTTIEKLVKFLGHDDARKVTPGDVVRFKDYRLSEVNPKSGKPASPKTVKDSDLAGLKAIFGWAVSNRLLPSNPAEGITIKLGKPKRLRSKGFTDAEANAILKAALGSGPIKVPRLAVSAIRS